MRRPQRRAATTVQAADGAPILRVRGATKRYGDVVAVDDVTIEIRRGEIFSLLGGSGCGKTTLLRLMAGFERPDSGTVEIDGVDVTATPPYERPVNMMFQSYALFPHMSVERNVGFGLVQDGLPKGEIRDRVAAALELVQLGGVGARRPDQLSGGQRQRVALARALVKRPKILLLDEPLAALDKKLRERTQFELVGIQEQVGVTFVIVTHDQEEAMTMSTRIAVMDRGRIVQTGAPGEIYEYPRSRFVADFIGLVNLLEGTVEGTDGAMVRVRADGMAPLVVADDRPLAAGRPVAVAIRPEKIRIDRTVPEAPENALSGTIRDIAYLGDVSIFHVETADGRRLSATRPNLRHAAEQPFTWEERVWLSWTPENAVVIAE